MLELALFSAPAVLHEETEHACVLIASESLIVQRKVCLKNNAADWIVILELCNLFKYTVYQKPF